MAEVTIEVGGRRYGVACRDGEEEHLLKLALLVDEKAEQVRTAVGSANESRQLLLAALLLADELSDLRASPTAASLGGSDSNDAALAAAIERLAGRVESVADALEGRESRH